MRGMTARTTYWHKSENPDREFSHERVVVNGNEVLLTGPSGTIVVKNGDRIKTARIIRPIPEPTLQFRVRGWDKRTNTVNKLVDTMDEALDLAADMLHAKIRPVPRKEADHVSRKRTV